MNTFALFVLGAGLPFDSHQVSLVLCVRIVSTRTDHDRILEWIIITSQYLVVNSSHHSNDEFLEKKVVLFPFYYSIYDYNVH